MELRKISYSAVFLDDESQQKIMEFCSRHLSGHFGNAGSWRKIPVESGSCLKTCELSGYIIYSLIMKGTCSLLTFTTLKVLVVNVEDKVVFFFCSDHFVMKWWRWSIHCIIEHVHLTCPPVLSRTLDGGIPDRWKRHLGVETKIGILRSRLYLDHPMI